MKKIMVSFAQLPIDHGLGEMNDFRSLFRVIEKTVVSDNLLRSLYIEFLRDETIELQVRFEINWRSKIVSVASGKNSVDKIMLPTAAEAAEGKDFLRCVSLPLVELHGYVEQMITEGEYDSANWTVELRDRDRDPDVAARAKAAEIELKLREETPEYLAKREQLEASQPIGVTYRKRALDMILRVIQRK